MAENVKVRVNRCRFEMGIYSSITFKCYFSLLPVLVHGERAKHNLQPDYRLFEEELQQGWVAANASCKHIAVNLEIHETYKDGKRGREIGGFQ